MFRVKKTNENSINLFFVCGIVWSVFVPCIRWIMNPEKTYMQILLNNWYYIMWGIIAFAIGVYSYKKEKEKRNCFSIARKNILD